MIRPNSTACPRIAPRRGWFGGMIGTLMLAAGCAVPEPRHPATGRVVDPLPIVSLEDPSSPAPPLSARVTLLNFWGTWCPPCRRELPGLARLAARLADEPAFQLVAVSCGPGDDPLDELRGETLAFLRDRDLAIRSWAFADAQGKEAVFALLGLDAFPTTLLIGPDGRVRRVWRGYRPRDETDIARAVVDALKELGTAAQPAG
jgi:thiol-disulfide isomerase/thioredoxin